MTRPSGEANGSGTNGSSTKGSGASSNGIRHLDINDVAEIYGVPEGSLHHLVSGRNLRDNPLSRPIGR